MIAKIVAMFTLLKNSSWFLFSCVGVSIWSLFFSGQDSKFNAEITVLGMLIGVLMELVAKSSEALNMQITLLAKLNKFDPLLELSDSDKILVTKLVSSLKGLDDKASDWARIITKKYLNHCLDSLNIAATGSAGFSVFGILQTNKALLESLKKDDEFSGVSIIVNPLDWRTRGYLDDNIKKAKEGVKIARVFVLDNNDKTKQQMDPIMQALADTENCEVHFYINEVSSHPPVEDITIVKRGDKTLALSAKADSIDIKVEVCVEQDKADAKMAKFKEIIHDDKTKKVLPSNVKNQMVA